jgi:hypothetical protein
MPKLSAEDRAEGPIRTHIQHMKTGGTTSDVVRQLLNNVVSDVFKEAEKTEDGITEEILSVLEGRNISIDDDASNTLVDRANSINLSHLGSLLKAEPKSITLTAVQRTRIQLNRIQEIMDQGYTLPPLEYEVETQNGMKSPLKYITEMYDLVTNSPELITDRQVNYFDVIVEGEVRQFKSRNN